LEEGIQQNIIGYPFNKRGIFQAWGENRFIWVKMQVMANSGIKHWLLWLKHNALILSPYNLGGPQYDSLANIIPITDQINIVLSAKIEVRGWFGITNLVYHLSSFTCC
jgi:hypothetical protein